MEEVKSSIKIILPAITDELLESLLSVLVDLGVDDIHHLELVEESDLTPVLKKIQARLLVKEWRKNKEHIESTNQATVVVEENSMPIETVPSTSKPKYERTFFNPHTYNIPWESMPEELLRSLNENKRPKPTLRQKMVRIISDHIHQQIKRPGVKILAVVAEKIVHQYPQSFTDEVSSQINGTSHLSLLKQLERRLDNINRGDIINVLKRKSKNNDETIKKVKLSDSYGCVNYQPDLPLTETTQSQAEKQQMMKESYAANGAVLNIDNRTLLQDTYSSIRIDINSGRNLQFLTVEWPLLFTKEGFIDHFNTLVDVNVERKLGLAISKLGVTIISYFIGDPKVKPSAKDKLKALTEELKKNAQKKEDMFTWPILISLLMTYFQDDIDTLFVIVEIASSVGEVEMSVPNTPCLICCGYNMQNVTSFMLAIDSKIVIMEIETFEMGLALLISSFFCLNIEYPASASTTLEFIQRCFLDINPLKGSKVDSSKKMKGVNPKIVSLKKKITDFEWNL